MNKLMNVDACAKFCGVSPASVYVWISKGLLPHQRLGRALVIRMKDAKNLVQKQKVRNPLPDEPKDSSETLRDLERKISALNKSFADLLAVVIRLNNKMEDMNGERGTQNDGTSGRLSSVIAENYGDFKKGS